jgi:hypothetical protein
MPAVCVTQEHPAGDGCPSPKGRHACPSPVRHPHMRRIQYAISRRHTDAGLIHFYGNSLAHKPHASPQQSQPHKLRASFIEGNRDITKEKCVLKDEQIYLHFCFVE